MAIGSRRPPVLRMQVCSVNSARSLLLELCERRGRCGRRRWLSMFKD